MITINRRDLTAALKRAARLTSKASYAPALRTTQLTFADDGVILRSTNLEQSLTEILPATGRAKQVTTCVSVAQLLSVLVALPQYMKDVPLEVSADFLLVGTTKLTAAFEATDFPVISRVPDNAQAVVELPQDFPQHLRFCRAAVSPDSTRVSGQGSLTP